MILDIEHIFDKIYISYFDKEGKVKLKEYKLREFPNWVTCSMHDKDKSDKFINWDGKPVKLSYDKRLNKWSLLEFIHNLPKADRDEIEALYFPKIQSVDIETEVIDDFPKPEIAKEKVTCISISMENNSTLSLGWKKLNVEDQKWIFEEQRNYLKKFGDWNFKYVSFDNEYDMLKFFIYNLLPKFSLVTGWNWFGFDWLYIFNRCRILGIDVSLASPTRAMSYENIPLHIGMLDYLTIYKRWDRTVQIKESNKLDWVAGTVLGVTKLHYNGTLQELYENDYLKYILYNAIDSALVVLLHKKLKTLDNILSMSSLCSVPINKSSSPVALTESLLWKGYYERGKVIGNKRIEVDKTEYEGAYVKQPQPGMYRAVACFDFASLYPSIMRQFNISPESFIKKAKSEDVLNNYKEDKDYLVAVTGAIYDKKEESVLKNILDDLYSKRKIYKNRYLLIEQKLSEAEKK